MPAYKRILLKLSGEALMGDDAYGINRATIVRMVREVRQVTERGVEVAVVIGGGNIFRGVAGGAGGMDRATADYMGMLATVINGLALQDALEQAGVLTRVVTAIEMRAVAEPIMDLVDEMPYAAVDAVHMDPQSPMPCWDKGTTLSSLPAEAVDTILAEAGPDSSSPLVVRRARSVPVPGRAE